MNCDEVVRSVSSYIDGELVLALRQDFEVHLQGCKDCAIFVRQTKFTVEIFYDADLADLPADARSRLHEKLRRTMGESRK